LKLPFDEYAFRARLVPAIIAGTPAFAFAWIFIGWGQLGLAHLITGTGLVILFAVFADIARRRGLAIQQKIMDRMGGWPTTVTLRHSDPTYDEKTKSAFHAFIAGRLGESAPTKHQEAKDPIGADAYYERGSAWLRENTRDRKKFNILFNENVSYGFRRNLLGLKLPGFLLNASIVIICLLILWLRSPVDFSDAFNDKLLTVIVVAFLHAAYLLIFVTETGVREAARTYSRQLLLSTQSQHLIKTSMASSGSKQQSHRKTGK
jgi:hypothetical protein